MSLFNRHKIAVTFATSAATASDYTCSPSVGWQTCLLKSVLVKTHGNNDQLASAASGAIVSIYDSDGNLLKTFAQIASGTTVFAMSGSDEILLDPNAIVRYAVTAKDVRCVSGDTVKTSEFPTATVILFTER